MPHPAAVVFRETLHIGDTDLSQEEVQQVVHRLGQEYKVRCGLGHKGARDACLAGGREEGPGMGPCGAGLGGMGQCAREGRDRLGFKESEVLPCCEHLSSPACLPLVQGNRYHLLQRNCNAFASDLCLQLVGKRSPGWVRPSLGNGGWQRQGGTGMCC